MGNGTEKKRAYLEMARRDALDAADGICHKGIFPDVLDDILEFLGASKEDRPNGSGRGNSDSNHIRGVGMDADTPHGPVDWQKHDEREHGGHFDPETMTCTLRDDAEKADKGDADVATAGGKSSAAAAASGTHSSSASSPSSKPSSPDIPGISKRKVKEYRDLMARKHPEMDADKLLAELGKIGDRKVQGDAFRWAMKGAARLPEDLYKVEEARQLADRAKVDPLQYDTPQGCIDALKGNVKVKEKPIDPDTVPELSDKKVLPMGVTTYLVQDDREGQQAMRKIINTHWGKDANPWCLLHGDGEGNLSDGTDGLYDAAHYWKHYSALPKRVAFKDGKLLAFMATDVDPSDNTDVDEDDLRMKFPEQAKIFDETDLSTRYIPPSFVDWMFENHADKMQGVGEQWWDRQDKDHEGIPVGNMPVPGDEFGRWADYEIRDGKAQIIGGMYKGKKGEPGYAEFNEDGSKIFEIDKNGAKIEFYRNGKVHSRCDGHGNRILFHENGIPEKVHSDDDMFIVSYDDNGNVTSIYDYEIGDWVQAESSGDFSIAEEYKPGDSLFNRRRYNVDDATKNKYREIADSLLEKWRQK